MILTLQAALLLRKQLAELNKNPVEGFSAGLIDDEDIFRWEVSSLDLLWARAITICVVGYDNWSPRHSLRGRILQVSPVFPHRVSTQTSCVKVSLISPDLNIFRPRFLGPKSLSVFPPSHK